VLFFAIFPQRNFISFISNICNFYTKCNPLYRQRSKHIGHEGKFYRRPNVGHRTLCQLSSRHGLRIYGYSAKTALTTISRAFPEGKMWDSKVRTFLSRECSYSIFVTTLTLIK